MGAAHATGPARHADGVRGGAIHRVRLVWPLPLGHQAPVTHIWRSIILRAIMTISRSIPLAAPGLAALSLFRHRREVVVAVRFTLS